MVLTSSHTHCLKALAATNALFSGSGQLHMENGFEIALISRSKATDSRLRQPLLHQVAAHGEGKAPAPGGADESHQEDAGEGQVGAGDESHRAVAGKTLLQPQQL